MQYKIKVRKTEEEKQTHRDNRIAIIRGKGQWGQGKVGKGGQIYGDRRKLNYGWETCNRK